MRTPEQTVEVRPGTFVVQPPGEVDEYANGEQPTLLFRVCNGADMCSDVIAWRGAPDWRQSTEDAEYYRAHPEAIAAVRRPGHDQSAGR